MEEDAVLIVENVSKIYKTTHGNTFSALANISFELKKGETLGIIGENGAGKSTLLKVLSGITKPSSGRVVINGNLTSILDVGTGFHPDLTGVENIYSSGNLNGISKKEIDLIYDDLVAFSELGTFINQPIKTYSSGMFMRLAFSVFAFMRPEILLLDEVFSVGDIGFQNKCIKKINSLVKQGVSIILVTHNMNDIQRVCSKAAFLVNGELKHLLSANKAVDLYVRKLLLEKSADNIKLHHVDFKDKIGNDAVILTSITIQALNKPAFEKIHMEDPLVIILNYQKIKNESIQFVLSINKLGEPTLLADSNAFRENFNPKNTGLGYFEEQIIFPANFFNHGLFVLSLSVAKSYNFNEGSTELKNLIGFEVALSDWDNNNPWSKALSMPLRPQLVWTVKKK